MQHTRTTLPTYAHIIYYILAHTKLCCFIIINMYIGEICDFQCNQRKLSKQMCSPIPTAKSCIFPKKKHNAPSSFNECTIKSDPYEPQEYQLMRTGSEFNTTSLISTLEDDDFSKILKAIEEKACDTTESYLDNLKSPHCYIPPCNDLKAVIERACPKSNSYSKFLVNTYSAFSFFKKANLQEPSSQDIKSKMLNLPKQPQKSGMAFIKDVKQLYLTWMKLWCCAKILLPQTAQRQASKRRTAR
jgi:hypothetical protein